LVERIYPQDEISDGSVLPEDGAALIKEPAGTSKVNGPVGRSHPVQGIFAVAGR